MKLSITRAAIVVVIVCAACSRGNDANQDSTVIGGQASPLPAQPNSAAVQKPAPAEAPISSQSMPARTRVTRKPDSIIGRDSVITLPRRTLPLATPKTP
jgi:hypothetical protein